MPSPLIVRECIFVRRAELWPDRYSKPDEARAFVRETLAPFLESNRQLVRLVDIHLPSQWRLESDDDVDIELIDPELRARLDQLIVTLELEFSDSARTDEIERVLTSDTEEGLPGFLRVNLEGFVLVDLDLPLRASDHWDPGDGDQVLFARRRDAHALIEAPYLATQGLNGLGVNVVIIDQGVDRNSIPANYVTGWSS